MIETTKHLPESEDIEEVILGGLLIDKAAIYHVIGLINEDDFSCPKRQKVYESIIRLEGRALPIDLVTVADDLKRNNNLNLVGGASFLAGLTNRVASTANIEYHSYLLKQKSIRRKVIKLSAMLHEKGFDESIDDLELLELAEQSFSDISQHRAGQAYETSERVVMDIVKTQEMLLKNPDTLIGLPVSCQSIGKILQGWRGSKFIVIAARPGMGKTTFVTSEIRYLAVQLGIPVGMFSLEMSSEQLIAKITSAECEINDRLINDWREATDYQAKMISEGLDRVSSAPIYINTRSGSIDQIKSGIRLMVREKGVKIIFVDYLQLISGNGKEGNREQEVSKISRALKLLTMELDVPIIALSQLSRAVETRGGAKRPMLSDLRESGSIEQDADIVGFIYRPEYYDIMEDEEGNSLKDVAEFIIAKNRGGALKNCKLKFAPEYSKFSEWVESGNKNFEPEVKPYNGTIIKAVAVDTDEDLPF